MFSPSWTGDPEAVHVNVLPSVSPFSHVGLEHRTVSHEETAPKPLCITADAIHKMVAIGHV